MIKGITGGRFVQVQGGTASNPYISPGSSGAGMVRWNSNMQTLEVNDGVGWQSMPSNIATVTLDGEAIELLEWAKREQHHQLQREQSVKNNPALKKAYEAIRRAEENFDLLENIAREHENDNTSSI